MFTGIIDHCGVVFSIEPNQAGSQLWIETEFSAWQLGESIAIDGICLTVSDFADHRFACVLSPETLRLTTAGHFAIGTRVNVERAMKLEDRFGGHMVTGHIDGRVRLLARSWQGEFLQLTLGGLASDAMRYFCRKGSVALNGVSLTVNAVHADSIEVLLVPHTLSRTNLSELAVGAELNVEYDYLARYVVRQLDFKQ